MPSFSIAQNANASFSPSFVPVLVATGATSGIAQSLVEIISRHLHGRIHIVLVGRNKAAAAAIIASLPPTTHENATYEFIQRDITLMSNVHTLAQDLVARLPKINYLVHAAGVFGLRGRVETPEGIDVKLASRYYARWALTYDLLPLLHKAKDLGEPASVLSILGAGASADTVVDVDDLGLKKRYSGWKAMMQSINYNDLMVAEFSEREPEIAFTHIYPGNVSTGMLKSSNPIFSFFLFLMKPLFWLMTRTPQKCAEYMLFALLDAEKGLYRRNENGDIIGMEKFPQAKNAQKLLWEHTSQTVGAVDH